MLVWIDDMMGMTEHKCKRLTDEEQFQSAMRAMVVLSIITFQERYCIWLPKCFLIPEEVMVGKEVSLECAVPAGMWYTRFQYAAMRETGLSPDSSRPCENKTMVQVTADLL